MIQISERPGAHATPEGPTPPDRLRRALAWTAGVARRLPLSADDLVALLIFAGLALIVTAQLWGTAATEANPRDHALFVYFFERGLSVLLPRGRLGFIVTNKWLRAGYAEPLRRMLARETLLEMLVVLALIAGLVGPRVLGYFRRVKAETARVQI